VRVLKPVGRLGIADFWSGTYARHLRERGLENVQQLALGWRFWLRTWAWGRPGHGDQTVRRSRLISSGSTAPIQALMAARARPEGGSWARDVPRRRRPYAGQRLELAGYASAVRLQ
jgi:hypothetical protein